MVKGAVSGKKKGLGSEVEIRGWGQGLRSGVAVRGWGTRGKGEAIGAVY